MDRQERNNLIDKIIRLSNPPSIERAFKTMQAESDQKLRDRYERLKHNNSKAVNNYIDKKINEMVSGEGYTSNTMLD